MKDLIDKGLLGEFLSGLKSLFAAKDVATASAAGLMSAADKAKLKAQVSDQQTQLDEQAAAIEELAGIAAGGE